jgi:uncharacterized protein (DUF302 family)
MNNVITEAAAKGIILLPSRYSVAETMNLLAQTIKAHGLTIFASIDFSGDGQVAGMVMRSTQMLIFGNPKAGTPLMNVSPTAALDLPLKALISQYPDNSVWVAINDPRYLQKRHDIPEELVKNISGAGDLIKAALQ